ncbi:MAG: lipid carrier--UDP-N-acetylgalactosaminyltransferase [Bacteroidetes bacterium HGW-Bacteroidetes-23]|nr:MAG: lipid carrier--UDP-N-acetylgalactosaminyltransferase [Bacteroidetes bacterium HGW-Bacteroidetes-23]
MYKTYIKGILDLTAAFVGLILLSPIVVLTIIFLYFANQGKPFFIQPRPGKGGKTFNIIKFKTMNDKRDENGNLLSDAERLTAVGSIVRKTSMDEIPQLINILKGDMSLIGPRPLLTHYLHLYNDFQNRRHEVKPGITGWAQVNGRNAISWDKKFEYDVWYVDNISFWLDVKILFKTILKVIKKEGINAADAATIEPFDGN